MESHQGARELASRIGRVGVWSFALERHPVADAHEFAAEVERLGFGALWIPEGYGSKEAFSHAAVLLGASNRIVVATGIASIWARDPISMANGGKTLADAHPGRFLLGIGVSHEPAVQRRGGVYERPLLKMREYLDGMEAARYPAPEPAKPPPWVLAALGPRMLELAAERTSGAHPYFTPVEHTALARGTMGDGPLLAVEQAVVLERNADVARGIARDYMRHYLKLENYANNLLRLGWSEEDLGAGGSDALVDAIVAWGGPASIADRVRAHHDAGADHVCIQVLDSDPASLALEQLREIAGAVL